jgi:exopolyphosphatase/guanosine-5'-triphosphate,3'-diphosphate pyrophosphatase
MLRLINLGAIDIGSNSIRLLVSNVIPEKTGPLFKKAGLVRLPVRLGTDVFTTGAISDKNRKRIVKAMRAYKYIMEVHGVRTFRACATSAMREAANGPDIVEEIFTKTGIRIDIIDGQEEARLIFSAEMLHKAGAGERDFLYMDVGGGSTELTLFSNNELKASRSFNLGTLRILNGIDRPEEWSALRTWVKEQTAPFEDLSMVGSGGNINRLFKMSGKPMGVPLNRDYVRQQYEFLQKFSYEDLVKRFDFRYDRADVIIPALSLFNAVMEWGKSDKIFVPKQGLADGLVRDLWKQQYPEKAMT